MAHNIGYKLHFHLAIAEFCFDISWGFWSYSASRVRADSLQVHVHPRSDPLTDPPIKTSAIYSADSVRDSTNNIKNNRW